jgi:hypothetical protein
MGIAALAVAGVLNLGGGQISAPPRASLACPATLTVSETAAPLPGWSFQSDAAQHRFERISVFNRDGAKEYDLAPDDEKPSGAKVIQTWELQSYRELPLILTCRYQGTSATLSREIPKALNTCSQTIEIDKTGNIKGQSSMSCQ